MEHTRFVSVLFHLVALCEDAGPLPEFLTPDPKPETLGGLCPSSTCSVANSECKKANDDQDRCLCKDGFDEEETSMSCKTGAGQGCQSDEQCVGGTVCNDGVCKLDIGQPCTGFDLGVCRTDAVCEEPGICRVLPRGSCKEVDPTLCAVGTVCDPVFECRRSPGEACRDTTDCTAGAQCSHGKCQCNSNAAIERFGFCRPRVGKVGQECLKSEECPIRTVCEGGKCFCQTNSTLNRVDLTCGKSGKAEDEDESDGLPPNVLAAILGLVAALLILIIYLIMRRKRKKKEKALGVEQELINRMQALQNIQVDLPPPESAKLPRRIRVKKYRAKGTTEEIGTEVDPESYEESMEDPNK